MFMRDPKGNLAKAELGALVEDFSEWFCTIGTTLIYRAGVRCGR
jgi:hypothetical protein